MRLTPTPGEVQVLYEDNHLLVLNKPAVMPTMGSTAGTPSLWTMAKDYLKHKYSKPGNVFLGVVSRLDSPVTGIVVFARTSKAAGRLSSLFRDRDVRKEYWAIVSGQVRPKESQLINWLMKDDQKRKMVVAAPTDKQAREACLKYRVREETDSRSQGSRTLLRIELLTGRKHQIRVQLAHLGHPIVGDRKYGSRDDFGKGIALHASRLVFEHPIRKTLVDLTAPIPPSWKKSGFDVS